MSSERKSFVYQVMTILVDNSMWKKPSPTSELPFMSALNKLLVSYEEHRIGMKSMLEFCKINDDVKDIKSYLMVFVLKLIKRSEEKYLEELKERTADFVCPISRRVMQNPVVMKETGIHYEKENILGYLSEKLVCPKTKQRLKFNGVPPADPYMFVDEDIPFAARLEEFRVWSYNQGMNVMKDMGKFLEHEKLLVERKSEERLDKRIMSILEELRKVHPNDVGLVKTQFRTVKRMKKKRLKIKSEIDLLDKMFEQNHHKAFLNYVRKLNLGVVGEDDEEEDEDDDSPYSDEQKLNLLEKKLTCLVRRGKDSSGEGEEVKSIIDRLGHLYDDISEGDTESLLIEKIVPSHFEIKFLRKEVRKRDNQMVLLSRENKTLSKRVEKLEKFVEGMMESRSQGGGRVGEMLEEMDEQIQRISSSQILMLMKNDKLLFEQAKKRLRKSESVQIKIFSDKGPHTPVYFTEIFQVGSLPWTIGWYPKGKQGKEFNGKTDLILFSTAETIQVTANCSVELLNEQYLGLEYKVENHCFSPWWPVNDFCLVNMERRVWRFKLTITVLSIKKKSAMKM